MRALLVPVVLAVLVAGVIGACGSVVIEPPAGRLTVEVVTGPNGPIVFGGVSRRAQLTTPGGQPVHAFELEEPPAPIAVASGDYWLETWQVALSDVIMCPAAPAPAGVGCTRDEGPPQSRCRLALSVPPGSDVRVRYTVIDAQTCRLERV
ncbi:MAG TPA: hypothetical protein VFY18_02000 [Candidatus Limnocylindrales bacterium]|nr:hypothetical protein [Candidatus Limnocylindrales bacterium]